MIKENINDLVDRELISESESSWIYRLNDGRILKVIKPFIHKTCDMLSIKYENKISSPLADDIEEINKPLSIVYDGRCIGYTMQEIVGKTIANYDNSLPLTEQCNLNMYADLFNKLLQIIKAGNRKGIIFPDLCTNGNIIVTEDKRIKIIDFDGLQLGDKDKAISISTSLGNPAKYIESNKYSKYRFHFTKELDKASLTILMYLMVFYVDLANVGQRDLYGDIVTFKDFFDCIGLEDEAMKNKTVANLSDNKTGSFFEYDLYRLADKYRLFNVDIGLSNNKFIKRLVRK